MPNACFQRCDSWKCFRWIVFIWNEKKLYRTWLVGTMMLWMKIALSEVYNSDFIHREESVCVTFWVALYLVCLEGCHVLWLCNRKSSCSNTLSSSDYSLYIRVVAVWRNLENCAVHTQKHREKEYHYLGVKLQFKLC